MSNETDANITETATSDATIRNDNDNPVPGPDAAAVDITPDKDGGVLKEIKKHGSEVDGHPSKGNKVFVHYVGTLTDGTKFDSSRDRGDLFEFQLGKGQVIKAWDLGVATMQKGEIAVFTCAAKYAYGESGSPPKIPPNATLVFEVELFHWKGEDLSADKDEGILRSQIETGEGFQNPNDGATCEIHIIGKHNDRVFEDRDVEFVMGEGGENGIVDGVEIALKKFKTAEKSKLDIKAKYAYGADGNKDHGIPPNTDLHYEVTLKSFEKCKEAWEMDVEEKIEQSEIVKQKGTNFFKQGKYDLAVRYYSKIIDFLGSEEVKDENADKVKALKLAAHLNIAMSHLKGAQDFEVVIACEKALELDANSEKAYFRRGSARMNLRDYEEAQKDFKRVLEVDPENKAAKNQLTIAKRKIQQVLDKEKKTYAGMFQKFADIDTKKEKEQAVITTDQESVENDSTEGTTTEPEANGEVPDVASGKAEMEVES